MDEVVSMHPMVQMRNVWTIDDLRTLDVPDWWRYEILDGTLVVSPAAAGPHEVAGEELRAMIRNGLPSGYIVVGPMGIEIGRSYLVPDLVVAARTTVLDAQDLLPADVRLAIEIVSPGSVTDRITKPAKYAASGIAHYWRVETDPVSLTAYSLPAGTSIYSEIGTWGAGEVARLDQPFPVSIELDRLV